MPDTRSLTRTSRATQPLPGILLRFAVATGAWSGVTFVPFFALAVFVDLVFRTSGSQVVAACWASIVVHEVSHVATFVLLSPGDHSRPELVRRGLGVAVRLPVTTPGGERLVAVSGPVMGCLLGAGWALAAVPVTGEPKLVLAVVVAAVNLPSLLPWNADGAILFASRPRP